MQLVEERLGSLVQTRRLETAAAQLVGADLVMYTAVKAVNPGLVLAVSTSRLLHRHRLGQFQSHCHHRQRHLQQQSRQMQAVAVSQVSHAKGRLLEIAAGNFAM